MSYKQFSSKQDSLAAANAPTKNPSEDAPKKEDPSAPASQPAKPKD